MVTDWKGSPVDAYYEQVHAGADSVVSRRRSAMHHYEHTQPGTFMRVFMGVLIAVLVGVGVAMSLSGGGTAVAVGFLAPATVCTIVLVLFHSLTVRVSRDVIRLAFGGGLIHRSFAIADIEASAIVRNRWYYGWGIKLIRGGWLYNVSGFDAVEIQLKNGRRYRIGTDQPTELLAAVESAIAETS
jgi:hypothetical protein